MTENEIIKKLNQYGKNKNPVLFIINFDLNDAVIIDLAEALNNQILFDINGIKNHSLESRLDKKIIFDKLTLSYDKYHAMFNEVHEQLSAGNSYLLNLTQPTIIETNLTLKEIFLNASAKYKLLLDNSFVVFSPETFIKIIDNTISSYPMKGTIDASLSDAENIILSDEKEFAEHITIVDLIRNDLSIIADNVKVENFRYIDKITARGKTLLQVSSKITGKLKSDWNENLGDLLVSILPAGSVTGAPKKKTVEIIKNVEKYDRGYYTGVFGYYDGIKLDSGVMIRFIENIENKYYYKSGGGITIYSDPLKEYNELAEKIYVPFA